MYTVDGDMSFRSGNVLLNISRAWRCERLLSSYLTITSNVTRSLLCNWTIFYSICNV